MTDFLISALNFSKNNWLVVKKGTNYLATQGGIIFLAKK